MDKKKKVVLIRIEDIVDELDDIIEGNPSSSDAWLHAAMAYARIGDHEKAMKYYTISRMLKGEMGQ